MVYLTNTLETNNVFALLTDRLSRHKPGAAIIVRKKSGRCHCDGDMPPYTTSRIPTVNGTIKDVYDKR